MNFQLLEKAETPLAAGFHDKNLFCLPNMVEVVRVELTSYAAAKNFLHT